MDKKTQPKISMPPWQSPREWTELVWALSHTSDKNQDRLGSAISLAGRIKKRLERVSSDLDLLCSSTCAACTDICCRKATVWYDFKDLLFVYFSGLNFPESQIIKKENSCPHLTEKGCILPRTARPFICTWYICPAQKKCLALPGPPSPKNSMVTALEEIKQMRKKLEDEFIRAVSWHIDQF
ncbi:MAG: hypothetical protein U9P10_02195 [Thermodesulfobacteriota bacterium]|nr:hypothetical protein [Thermodesulfobacteriota bacterium]